MRLKLIFLIFFCVVFATGCARQMVVSKTGEIISDSYREMQEKGMPTAEEVIKAWPYVSGFMRGLLAEEFSYKMTPAIINAVKVLDDMAIKYKAEADNGLVVKMTKGDSGIINGCVIRLEYLIGKELYERYGITVLGLIKKYIV